MDGVGDGVPALGRDRDQREDGQLAREDGHEAGNLAADPFSFQIIPPSIQIQLATNRLAPIQQLISIKTCDRLRIKIDRSIIIILPLPIDISLRIEMLELTLLSVFSRHTIPVFRH